MQLIDPRLDFVFEVRVRVGEPLRIGGAGGEERWFSPIMGGTVSGPRLNGEVLPYGGDWWSTRPPGSLVLDARYLLRSDDGAIISIHNPGRYEPEESDEAPETEDGAAEWGEAFPRFDTAAREYAWLRESVIIGRGHEGDDGVHLRFFRLSYRAALARQRP
ncbi:DUF3237 domain-containing protein [Leucobacter sp. wl10]|nr:DUF3237 domain-containing protein [Leucobacter sp. wl10]